MKRQGDIIEDLHRLRAKTGRAHDFDVQRIAATIRQHEQESPDKVVYPASRRTARQKKSA